MTTPSHNSKKQTLTREQELSQKLRLIMETLEGLSFKEIETMLANIQASAKQDGVLRFRGTDAIEYQDIKPPK